MTGSALDRFTETVLHRRWIVLAAATLVMLAASVGAGFVGVTNDYRSLFDKDNPQLAALNALEANYGASNRALSRLRRQRRRCCRTRLSSACDTSCEPRHRRLRTDCPSGRDSAIRSG